ncbi:MAG: hypothetical protein RIB98_16270 [Acidimicrobiales bacterium]
MTTDPSASVPALRQSATMAAIATASALLLVRLPVSGPPGSTTELETWWAELGTAGATIALLRHVGIAVAGWLAVVAVLGLAAALTRSAFAAALWRFTAPRSLRRALLASVATITVSVPGVAHAADPAEPPLLHDLGPVNQPVDETGPVLRDLGPAPDPVPSGTATATTTETSPSTAATWTVAPGDHLWRIAEETMAERGATPTTASVTAYWQRLIDENRTAIGDDVDLIHPGLVLSLPD